MRRRTQFRNNKEQILRSETIERLYLKKFKDHKIGNLKAEFKVQEEKKMIKLMERSYLKAHQGYKESAARVVVEKFDDSQVKPKKSKSEKKLAQKKYMIMGFPNKSKSMNSPF